MILMWVNVVLAADTEANGEVVNGPDTPENTNISDIVNGKYN